MNMVEVGFFVDLGLVQGNIEVKFGAIGLEPQEGLETRKIKNGYVEFTQIYQNWLIVEVKHCEEKFRVCSRILVVFLEYLWVLSIKFNTFLVIVL